MTELKLMMFGSVLVSLDEKKSEQKKSKTRMDATTRRSKHTLAFREKLHCIDYVSIYIYIHIYIYIYNICVVNHTKPSSVIPSLDNCTVFRVLCQTTFCWILSQMAGQNLLESVFLSVIACRIWTASCHWPPCAHALIIEL